jgi:glycosyltransferase involved in cell wall biosynthesis
MKVCKIVINSVSHDARVLKEAEAIIETGREVVIVGIQDGNNSCPIQVLDNGIAIRRVAWQASAFRPNFFHSLWQIGLVLVAVIVALALAFWLEANYQTLFDYITFDNALYAAASASLILSISSIWKNYSKRRKSYLNLKKRERDELLKYEADFADYRRMTDVPHSGKSYVKSSTKESNIESSTKESNIESSTKESNIKREFYFPRPIMVGFIKALTPSNLRRWKVVLARERQIFSVLKDEAPDIVHAHDLSALPVAAKYAKAKGAKLVFDAHEMYDHLAQSEDELSELNGKILRKYAAAVDLFITINDSISNYYRKNYPALPRAVVIKNAAKKVDVFEYDGRLHAAAGLPRERKILIYQGGYAPKRGLISLLLSAEYLNPNWSIVFMGWGKLEEELRRVADSLKMKNTDLAERIRFVPRVKQSELPYWTAGASLGAIPYENTGLNHWYCNPNKLWEYPNAGVPILASPFPELRKMICDNEIGWLLPDPLNARDIAAAVNGLDDQQLEIAAMKCRRFIAGDNWDLYANRLKQAYRVFQ